MVQLQVRQECPQCGGIATISENDRLVTCSYCGVKNFLYANGVSRYLVPPRKEPSGEQPYLCVPYIRFKGTVFQVIGNHITHRVVDTTQIALKIPGLPPSLGVRPQAMELKHLSRTFPARYMLRSMNPGEILGKAAMLSQKKKDGKGPLFHQAYIGEALSIIYLPVMSRDESIVDAVNGLPAHASRQQVLSHKTTSYNQKWAVSFLATLCPHCGASLDGQPDSLVVICANCHRGWFQQGKALKQLFWQLMEQHQQADLLLPFWKITATIPGLDITTFTDFVTRINQPIISKPDWQNREMAFWVPAFKLRPKFFLLVGRYLTLGQHRLGRLIKGEKQQSLFPVTLHQTEALQAIKLIVAAATTSPKKVFPYLAEAQVRGAKISLVYLPFSNKGHEWIQPHTGAVIGKNLLKFGRAM